MNRSKLFLGLTTCVLAVVGVAAAKGHKFTTKHFGYYTDGVANKHYCTFGTTVPWYTSGTVICTTQNASGNGLVNVFTAYRAHSTCSGNTLYSNHTPED